MTRAILPNEAMPLVLNGTMKPEKNTSINMAAENVGEFFQNVPTRTAQMKLFTKVRADSSSGPKWIWPKDQRSSRRLRRRPLTCLKRLFKLARASEQFMSKHMLRYVIQVCGLNISHSKAIIFKSTVT